MKQSIPRRLFLGAVAALVFTCGCEYRSADTRVEVTYFDFSTAQVIADKWSQTDTIDFGTIAGRRSLLKGWSIDEVWKVGDFETFVWGAGESSELRLFRFAQGDFTIRFRCQSLTGPQGPITPAIRVEVNGTAIAEVELVPGAFRTYDVVVSSESLSVGENRIVFQYGRPRWNHSSPTGDVRDLRVAWDWLEVGPSLSQPTDIANKRSTDGTLILPLNTRTDFYVDLRSTRKVEWDAIRPWNAASTSAMELRIEVEPDLGEKRTFAIRTSGLKGYRAGSQTLPPVRGFARISFLAVPGTGDTGSGGAQGFALNKPRLVGPPEPFNGASSSQVSKGQPVLPVTEQWNSPNVIVYLIDTLRADHLGTYGYSEPVSPEIDAFAADAVVFDRAFAQSSWTKTSVASILTGLLPHSHGTFERGDILPPIPSLLPKLLQDAGYRTVAVSASGIITPDRGFDRGFEEFLLIEPTGDDLPVFAYSDVVTDRFLHWLSEHPESGEPFFAYLHTVDPHEPYGPPDLDGNPPPDRGSELWEFRRPDENMVNAFLATQPELSKLDIRDHFLQLYEEDISFNDRQFGRLIEALKGLGIYDSTIIVLLSDHGEEFFDHGHWAHGRTLFSEQLHVPLLLKLPDQNEGGRRVAAIAQHVDLVPTLLEGLDLAVPQEVEGRSLIPLIRERSRKVIDPASRTVVVSNLRLDGTEIDSILRNNLHLMRWKPDQPDERVELYDLKDDPNERFDLAPHRPAAVGFLRTLLKTSILNRTVSYEPEHLRIEGDIEKRLRALGYIK